MAATDKEIKISLSQEERDLLKIALMSAIEGTRRSCGKAKLQLVREAYARQEVIFQMLWKKLEVLL